MKCAAGLEGNFQEVLDWILGDFPDSHDRVAAECAFVRQGGILRPGHLLLRNVVNPFVTLKSKAMTLEAALQGSYVHGTLKSLDELVAWCCKLHGLQYRDSKVMQAVLLVCLFLRSRVLAEFLFEALTEMGELVSGGDFLAMLGRFKEKFSAGQLRFLPATRFRNGKTQRLNTDLSAYTLQGRPWV